MSSTHGDLDIIACASGGGVTCLQIFSYATGVISETRYSFRKRRPVKNSRNSGAFISQYYIGRPVPGRFWSAGAYRSIIAGTGAQRGRTTG